MAGLRIEQALLLYLGQLNADGRSIHTVRQAGRHIRLLARYLPEHNVDEVQPADLARFLVSPSVTKCAGGRAKRTTSMNALRSSVRCFYGYLEKAGALERDPSRLIRLARSSRAPPRGLTASEKAKLLAAFEKGEGPADERDRVLFSLMMATGIRVSSALALEVRDVDLDEGEILLRKVKGGGEQRVFVPKRVAEHLRTYIGARKSGPLFQSGPGRALGARQAHRRLGEWCDRAGIARRVHPHALRHGFALSLYERTGDLLIVQSALGHRSIESSAIYARASADRVRAAVLAT